MRLSSVLLLAAVASAQIIGSRYSDDACETAATADDANAQAGNLAFSFALTWTDEETDVEGVTIPLGTAACQVFQTAVEGEAAESSVTGTCQVLSDGDGNSLTSISVIPWYGTVDEGECAAGVPTSAAFVGLTYDQDASESACTMGYVGTDGGKVNQVDNAGATCVTLSGVEEAAPDTADAAVTDQCAYSGYLTFSCSSAFGLIPSAMAVAASIVALL